MQDDCYLLAADGWTAETYRIIQVNKKGKEVDKGWDCDLAPKGLIVNRYFSNDQKTLDALIAQAEALTGQMGELEKEHSTEDGYFGGWDKVSKVQVQARLKELKHDPDAAEERQVLQEYLELSAKLSAVNVKAKTAAAVLDDQAYRHYKTLTTDEIKTLVVDDKWLAAITQAVQGETERISQRLAMRIKELAERYETPLPIQQQAVSDLETKIKAHLEKMGFVC